MKRHCFIMAGWLFLTWPSICHAYLDPGSGNALIYMAISLAGAAAYFVKNVGYKIIGKISGKSFAQGTSKKAADEEIVIFSEGKAYWYTFKPIVESFIAKGQRFGYLSMDVEDPGLAIEHDLMNSRYVGDGSGGFARIASSTAKVMLATTPNIGTKGYPLPRPEKVECLAHIFHSVNDVGLYQREALDYYDSVIMPGEFVTGSIRQLEKKRGQQQKECTALGLPYLDVLAETGKSANGAEAEENIGKVILVAPSWGDKNSLRIYGAEFIGLLAEAGYTVIIRPHPQSKKLEQSFIAEIRQNFCEKYPNVRLDLEMDGSQSMAKADILISDKSSIRFDFAFLYEKPVLTLDIPNESMAGFEAADLDEAPWEERVSHRLGERLTLDSLPQDEKERAQAIFSAALRAINTKPDDLKAFRNETIANFGHSGECIAAWAIAKKNSLVSAGEN